MAVPAMDYVGLVFNVVLLALSVFGYIYISNKAGKRWSFILFFACAWLVSALSYILLICGIDAASAMVTGIRILLYILFVAATVSLIVELVKK
jgi:hypothetical protein